MGLFEKGERAFHLPYDKGTLYKGLALLIPEANST